MSENGAVKFELDRDVQMFSRGLTVARLIRNDVPVGMVRLNDEDEFEWLKSRIDGTYDPEVEAAREETGR